MVAAAQAHPYGVPGRTYVQNATCNNHERTQLINLRAQAESQSKSQNLFDKRVGGWITWQEVHTKRDEWHCLFVRPCVFLYTVRFIMRAKTPQLQVQRARVKAEELASKATDDAGRRTKLRDYTAVSLLSLIPPDRVGLIRKLRVGHTLKRVPASASEPAGWRIDLTKQRDGHKTSRFYGKGALPSEHAQPTPIAARDTPAHRN